jgi:WD40 repeat protein
VLSNRISRRIISDSPCKGISFSPDGGAVAFSSGCQIIVWDVYKGNLFEKVVAGDYPLDKVSFSPDGRRIVSTSEGGAYLWQVIGNPNFPVRILGNKTTCAAFSPDGRTLAIGSDDAVVRLLNVDEGYLLRTLEKHKAPISSVAFSPKGDILVSGGYDGAVWVWDMEYHGSAIPLPVLEPQQGKAISLAFSSDSRTLVTGGCHSIQLWNANNLELLLTERMSTDANITAVAFSNDNGFVLHGDDRGTIYVRRAADGEILYALNGGLQGVNHLAVSRHDVLAVAYQKGARLYCRADALTASALRDGLNSSAEKLLVFSDMPFSLRQIGTTVRLVSRSDGKDIGEITFFSWDENCPLWL